MEKKLNPLMINLIILSTLLLSHSTGYADTNIKSGRECSEADDSASRDPFESNLSILLNILSLNGAVQDGFYKSKTGKDKYDEIYGLVQCRGDISAGNCSNCIQESIKTAFQDCPKSKKVKIWFTWCFLRYSDENFLDEWDQTSAAIYNDTDIDDASVGSKGINFMTELASTAPRQALMFQTAVLDVGESGKRYGLAQCTRDISSGDCEKCLGSELITFRTTIGNKRGWEIYGSSCSMWYHDFKFYSNINPYFLARNGCTRFSSDGVVAGITMAVVAVLFLVL